MTDQTTTIERIIRKFGLSPETNAKGERGVRAMYGKPTDEDRAFVREHKAEILAELDRLAAAAAQRKAAKLAEAAALRAAIRAGEVPIRLFYHDGEYLSGWQVFGPEAELLEELKLAAYVSGWGYQVDEKVKNALGETFTFPQAAAYAQPALDAAAAKRAAEAAARQAKFDQARQSGQPVVLDRYTDDCNDPRESCDIDTVTIYAMPDGSTRESRAHNW